MADYTDKINIAARLFLEQSDRQTFIQEFQDLFRTAGQTGGSTLEQVNAALDAFVAKSREAQRGGAFGSDTKETLDAVSKTLKSIQKGLLDGSSMVGSVYADSFERLSELVDKALLSTSKLNQELEKNADAATAKMEAATKVIASGTVAREKDAKAAKAASQAAIQQQKAEQEEIAKTANARAAATKKAEEDAEKAFRQKGGPGGAAGVFALDQGIADELSAVSSEVTTLNEEINRTVGLLRDLLAGLKGIATASGDDAKKLIKDIIPTEAEINEIVETFGAIGVRGAAEFQQKFEETQKKGTPIKTLTDRLKTLSQINFNDGSLKAFQAELQKTVVILERATNQALTFDDIAVRGKNGRYQAKIDITDPRTGELIQKGTQVTKDQLLEIARLSQPAFVSIKESLESLEKKFGSVSRAGLKEFQSFFSQTEARAETFLVHMTDLLESLGKRLKDSIPKILDFSKAEGFEKTGETLRAKLTGLIKPEDLEEIRKFGSFKFERASDFRLNEVLPLEKNQLGSKAYEQKLAEFKALQREALELADVFERLEEAERLGRVAAEKGNQTEAEKTTQFQREQDAIQSLISYYETLQKKIEEAKTLRSVFQGLAKDTSERKNFAADDARALTGAAKKDKLNEAENLRKASAAFLEDAGRKAKEIDRLKVSLEALSGVYKTFSAEKSKVEQGSAPGVASAATTDHLTDEQNVLERILKTIIEIGKEAKIAGVLILLKGPLDHFADELELLQKIEQSIVDVGNAAKIAGASLAGLSDVQKLERLQEQLGNVSERIAYSKEYLAEQRENAAAAATQTKEYDRLKAELKAVDSAIKALTTTSQANFRAEDVARIRTLQDVLAELRGAIRNIRGEWVELGRAATSAAAAEKAAGEGLTKAKADLQKALSAEAKKGKSPALLKLEEESRAAENQYKKDLEALKSSLAAKESEIKASGERIKNLGKASFAKGTTEADREAVLQREKAEQDRLRAEKLALEEQKRSLERAASERRKEASKAQAAVPESENIQALRAVVAAKEQDVAVTKQQAEATKRAADAKSEERRKLFEEAQGTRSAIQTISRELVLSRREAQDNISLLFDKEVQDLKTKKAELLTAISAIDNQIDVQAARKLQAEVVRVDAKLAQLEKLRAGIESGIQRLTAKIAEPPRETKVKESDPEAEAKKAKAAVKTALAEIDTDIRNVATSGKKLADILTLIGRGSRASSLTSGLPGAFGTAVSTPETQKLLSANEQQQRELTRLTAKGAADRLAIVNQEQQKELADIEAATARRVALLENSEAKIRDSVVALSSNRLISEETAASKLIDLEVEVSNERKRIATEDEAARAKVIKRALDAESVLTQAQIRGNQEVRKSLDITQKGLASVLQSFKGFREFTTQGFASGEGGKGPFDFGKIGDFIGNLPKLLETIDAALPPQIQLLFKASEAALSYVQALKSIINNAVEFAKNQRQVAASTNLANENIAAFTLGFQRAGQPVFSLDIGLASLQQKIATIYDSEKTAKAFDKMNVSVTDLYGNLKPTDQVLNEIAEDLATTGDSAEKAAARVEIFGIFGQRAIGLTLKTFKDLKKEAIETGLVLNEQAEGTLLEYYASVTRIETIIQGLINTLAVGLAPEFTDFNRKIGDAIKGLELKDPQLIDTLAAGLHNLLQIIYDGIAALGTLKKVLDVLSIQFNEFANAFRDEPDRIKNTANAIAGIASAIEVLSRVLIPFLRVYQRGGPIGGLIFGGLSDLLGDTNVFGFKGGAAVIASSIESIGVAADKTGEKVENLKTKLERFKRESEAASAEAEETIAKLKQEEEDRIEAIQRDRDQGKVGPFDAQQAIGKIQVETAEKISQIRKQQQGIEEAQLRDLILTTQRRTQEEQKVVDVRVKGIQESILVERKAKDERIKGAQEIALAEAKARQARIESDKFRAENRLANAKDRLDTATKASEAKPVDLSAQREAAAAATEFKAAQEQLEQLRLASIAVAAELDGLRKTRSQEAIAESEETKKQIQEQVNEANKAGKDAANAEREAAKTRRKATDEDYKAAQEQRDLLLQQGTNSLEEAVAREIGVIQDKVKRNIITEKEGNLERLKLERDLIEAKLKIQEGFARGANQPVKSKDTKSLAGIYDAEIQFFEKRVAFQKQAIALDDERLEGQRLLSKEARQQAAEDEQFLENLKRKRDEVVQGRIDQLKKERDAAPPESLQRARIDAEIAANQAILDGRLQTQAQITKNEEAQSKSRTELASKESTIKGAVVEDEISRAQRLIQIRQNELNLLEARANAEQEAIKLQSGLTQEQIEAGGADYRLTQARINASISLLKAKLSILDSEIATARAINAQDPQIISLEAQRLDLATQLNEVLRTRFELLDKAAAKEAEAFSKGAGAKGGASGVSTGVGPGKTYEELQANVLAAIKAQREAGAEALSGLAGLYTYYANLVTEAGKAGADQINGLIDKLQGDIRGLTNPGGAAIQGLVNYFTNQAKDALQAAFRRRDELFNAEAQKAAQEAADKALAERKRVEDGVKAIAQRQADAEVQAAERLEEQLKDLRKQREDAIREDAERRIELQENLAKQQADLEKRFIEEDIERARQAARERFDIELELQRSIFAARYEQATQAFNAAKDFAKRDYELRKSFADNETKLSDLNATYAERNKKVIETTAAIDRARDGAEKARLRESLVADTKALNDTLAEIERVKKEREALEADRANQAKLRLLEKERSSELKKIFDRAARGEIDKEQLDLLVRQLNQQFDLQKDYLNDRNEAQKTGDAEYLRQIEEAYNDQKAAQAALHAAELAADATFRAERKRRELEDEGLRQADRNKQRQDLIDSYNDQLKDLDKALQKRFDAIKENEKKVREEYASNLEKIKADSAKALGELGIAYDKFFEGLVDKIKNVSDEAAKALKSIGDLAGKVPDTKGSGAASGDGGSTTTSGPTTTSEGNPNGPSVGSGYQDPKDAPKGGSTSVGPANPYTGTPSGPSSTSGYQDPNKAPNGGPSTVGPAGGGGGGSSTTSSAGLGLRNKGQGGGNDLSGTADNGNRITFAGLSSEVLTNDIINKATGLKRGERATPKSAIDVLNYALNPYHYENGKKVYEPAYIKKSDYDRAVARIKDFYQPANIEALYKRRVISASYATGMIEDAFDAGFYGKQKAEPQYTRLLKAAFFEGKGDGTYAKYGDIIRALEDGKITPAQAWDQAARRSRLIGGDLDAGRVAVYLKQFWGYDANPSDANRPQGYDPAKDVGPALTAEGGGSPLGSDTPASSASPVGTVQQAPVPYDIGSVQDFIVSGGALLAGAGSIAGNSGLSAVGEIQGASPTYDTASVVDIGPVNLTRGKPGKIKPGPPIVPVGGLGGGGGTPNTGTKAITGIDTTAPGGPKTTPYQSGGGGGAVTGPAVTAYDESEGVAILKAEFRRIFDFAMAGTHTNQEIQNEINLAAAKNIVLGTKGLRREKGGIAFETYKRAKADLEAFATLTPQGFAVFTASPFFEGKYVPPPGQTNPAISLAVSGPLPALTAGEAAFSSALPSAGYYGLTTTASLSSFGAPLSGFSNLAPAPSQGLDVTGSVSSGVQSAAPFLQAAGINLGRLITKIVSEAIVSAIRINNQAINAEVGTYVFRG